MIGETKKELIIVCDKELQEYAEFLKMLISNNDDTEDKVVGTKDGTVNAAIYTEKEYEANKKTISSDNYVLFIGSFDEAKKIGGHVKFYFNKYGMHYGWLGRSAVMFVKDKMFSSEEYKKFIELHNTYVKKFYGDISCSSNSNDTKVAGAIGGAAGAAIGGVAGGVGAAGAAGAAIAGGHIAGAGAAIAGGPIVGAGAMMIAPIALPIVGGILGAAAIAGVFGMAKKKKEIRKQQYSCLIMALYLEGLQKFLEG